MLAKIVAISMDESVTSCGKSGITSSSLEMSEQDQKKETVTEVKTYAVGEHLFGPTQLSRCKLHPTERQQRIV